MHLRNRTFCLALVLLVGVCALPAEESPEEKIVREVYGDRIDEAKKTADTTDNLAVGRAIAQACEDTATPRKLRIALADTAVEVLMPVGSDDAMTFIQRALAVRDQLDPMEELERIDLQREMLRNRLTRAQKDREAVSKIREIAREVVQANLAYAERAARSEEHAAKANAVLYASRGLISVYRLTDMRNQLSAVTKRVRALNARRLRLKNAAAQLKAARESGNEDAVASARKALGRMYLQCDGDVATAGKYLKGADDPLAEAVAGVSTFLVHAKKPAGNKALEWAEQLHEYAESLRDDDAQKNVARAAQEVLKTYLASKPPAIYAAKARLINTQLDDLLGQTASGDLAAQIAKKYKGFHGKLTVIKDKRVKIVYDFSNPHHKKDWENIDGVWSIRKGVMATSLAGYGYGRILNKLRWRHDKPFKIQFDGQSNYYFQLGLNPYRNRRAYYSLYDDYFRLGKYGAYLDLFGSRWTDSNTRMKIDTPYTFLVEHDGDGKYVWKINGKTVKDVKPRRPDYARKKGYSFAVELMGHAGHYTKNIVAFDDVIIEGQIVLP